MPQKELPDSVPAAVPATELPAREGDPVIAGHVVEALRRHLQASLGRPVHCVETHISWVLLDGRHAWKIKKPVRLGFLDFGSLATRRHYCEEELRLNRRLAPELYLDVVPIRGSAAQPRLDGDEPAIDYAVRMVQFPPGSLLSEKLAAGTLDGQHVDRLAIRLAAFHEAAPRAPADSEHGSAGQIESATARVLAALARPDGDPRFGDVRAWVEATGHRLRPLFERRRAQGLVRECHGDLHLANAVALGDEVTAFDCIEFDPELRWIDLQNEIAFPVMDLLAHQRRDLAFRFLDAWLETTGDHAGLAVLRYYLVYRALVRAMVARIREAQGIGAPGPDYLGLAERLTKQNDPRLLITHGLSGSGKSFVARRLLEQAGAIRLRSDVERKRLFGLRALDDSSARVPGGIYRPADTQRTYARLLELARIALDAGYPVIVDAAFLRERERDMFRRAARDRCVPFAILHCQASPELLRERVRARQAGKRDASEADLSILERQLGDHDALRPDEQRVAIEVDTALSLDAGALAARWAALR